MTQSAERPAASLWVSQPWPQANSCQARTRRTGSGHANETSRLLETYNWHKLYTWADDLSSSKCTCSYCVNSCKASSSFNIDSQRYARLIFYTLYGIPHKYPQKFKRYNTVAYRFQEMDSHQNVVTVTTFCTHIPNLQYYLLTSTHNDINFKEITKQQHTDK